MQIRSLFALSSAIWFSSALQLQAAAPAQTETSVAIVELFTSEGCSSCPPADALLRRIQGDQTAAGQLIVGISEHVTYWNSLGWKDPYSAEVFTNRQTAYAARLSPEGPYTPQMVLNGREQFVGSDERALKQALQEDARQKHVRLRVLSSLLQGDSLVVRVVLDGTAHQQAVDLVAVLADDVDRSNVLRGENSGKELQHVSVARALTRLGTASGNEEQTIRIALPSPFLPAGSGHHLVLFAQEPHQGSIIGAATLPI